MEISKHYVNLSRLYQFMHRYKVGRISHAAVQVVFKNKYLLEENLTKKLYSSCQTFRLYRHTASVHAKERKRGIISF